MTYTLPTTGSGTSQAASVEDHEDAVNAEVAAAVGAEATARANAISTEAGARASGDTALAADIAAEADARADGDAALAASIAALGDLAAKDTVGTPDIDAGAVTNGKLADMSDARIKGRKAGAGTGAPQDMTAAEARTVLGLGNVDNTSDADKPVSAAQEAAIAAVAPQFEATANAVPHVGDGGQVAIWTQEGRLAARDATDSLARRITDRVAPRTATTGAQVPLLGDASQIALWMVGGRLAARDVTDGFARKITDRVVPRTPVSAPFIPVLSDDRRVAGVMQPDGFDVPVSRRLADRVFRHRRPEILSDGRTLHRWRARMGAYRAGVSGARPRVLLVGDSWVQNPEISNAVANLFVDAGFALSADGWHPTHGIGSVTGVTVSARSGWNTTDGSIQTTFPYGAGPDGQGVWTTGTTGVLEWSNLRATNIDIHSFGHGGTWRYQVDGGAWTTVVEASDGLRQITSISGLTDTTHTLRIDTTGNAGTVSIVGINSWRVGVDGPQVIRFGDAGTAAFRSINYLPYAVDVLDGLPPDLVVTILGTNDQSYTRSPPNVYADYLDALITTCRAANPDVGFVHILPPQTDPATVWYRLGDYLPAIRRVSEDRGTEFLSLYDLWGTWDQSNDAGVMADWGHPNAAGAAVIAQTLNRKFLEI